MINVAVRSPNGRACPVRQDPRPPAPTLTGGASGVRVNITGRLLPPTAEIRRGGNPMDVTFYLKEPVGSHIHWFAEGWRRCGWCGWEGEGVGSGAFTSTWAMSTPMLSYPGAGRAAATRPGPRRPRQGPHPHLPGRLRERQLLRRHHRGRRSRARQARPGRMAAAAARHTRSEPVTGPAPVWPNPPRRLDGCGMPISSGCAGQGGGRDD